MVAEPDGTAAARSQHHLLGDDRRLAGAIAGEKRAMDADRRAVDAAGHQPDHGRPVTAGRMLQGRVEAERGRRRQRSSPRERR